MAPDLNSVPLSPRPLAPSPRLTATTSTTASPRSSQQMPPPPLPLSSPNLTNILPSNQSAVANAQPLPSPGIPPATSPGFMADSAAVGTGPGPLRHPRPLTAADLHMQLEKEQEAVVNRLTRELSLLRAASNASVASNSSSTSATSGIPDITDVNSNHLLSGPSHPAPSTRRHQRSSSSTSARSFTGASVTNNNISGVAPERERPRANMNRHDSNPPYNSLSRQNSMTSSRRSGASSPALEYFPYGHTGRGPPPTTLNRERSSSSVVGLASGELERATTTVPTTSRYEEVAWHRMEMEAAKRENDMLKHRIRELERQLRTRRESDASATGGVAGSVASLIGSEERRRSETEGVNTGSVRGRDRVPEPAVDASEDAVLVGESARGGGIR